MKEKECDWIIIIINKLGALLLWGDNDPLFEHANALLPLIMKVLIVLLINNIECLLLIINIIG